MKADERSFSPTLRANLVFMLNKATEESNRQMAVVTGPHGFSIKQYGLLLLLEAEGPQAQIVLSEKVGLDRTTVMTTVDRLEKQGLVERRPDANDRRKNCVTLTEAGQRMVNQNAAQLQAAQDELFSELTKAEREQLHQLLNKLA
ncbi:MarR family winged helix-turn-helix transcriptional regulator [Deinococcus sp.]|uniref:MarR family winged helix-turn-helix transcriptional regulator n=1 Tax=Deinococcus sp. TaxID=47478 RepID=UPI003B58E1FB